MEICIGLQKIHVGRKYKKNSSTIPCGISEAFKKLQNQRRDKFTHYFLFLPGSYFDMVSLGVSSRKESPSLWHIIVEHERNLLKSLYQVGRKNVDMYIPASIFLFKVDNKNTRTTSWRCCGAFIVNCKCFDEVLACQVLSIGFL